MSVIKELILWLLFLLLIVAGLFTYYARTPIPLEHTPFEFSLKPGSSLKSAARQIQQAGGLNNQWLFVLLARGFGKTTQIKPGNYQLDHEVTPLQLLHMISKGQTEQSSLIIIEGTTFKELRDTLNAEPTLRHDSAKLSDAEILQRIGAAEPAAEGLFFPDTYNYSSGSSDIIVLEARLPIDATQFAGKLEEARYQPAFRYPLPSLDLGIHCGKGNRPAR